MKKHLDKRLKDLNKQIMEKWGFSKPSKEIQDDSKKVKEEKKDD